MKKIPRIIFNFNDVCLNNCSFCFIPFDKKGSGTLSLWKDILARANEFSPNMISFSGCDPFFYEDFYSLLTDTNKTCYWGVDSSLIWLNRSAFLSCASKIDQLSTSLDDVPDMPVFQRYSQKKLETFMENFTFAANHFPKLVVHTLFSKRNSNYLEQIADTLLLHNIKTWSLYQFWPFNLIKNDSDFCCTKKEFVTRGKEIEHYIDNRLDFEYVPYENRANGYFFVSSTGLVYTTLNKKIGEYKILGNIFDIDIYEKWKNWSNPKFAEKILINKIEREIKNDDKG